MKTIVFLATLLMSCAAYAQDWNVECNDGSTGNVHFVGTGNQGAAIFWDTTYSISQDYDKLVVSNQNLTIYTGATNAFLMVWHARNGNTYVWSYPIGQRNYQCR